MSDNLRRYRAIRQALKQYYPTCAGDLKIFQALDTLAGSQSLRQAP